MVKRFHSALAHRLGRNLAYYRKRAKLTQERLAEAAQVEVATISRYESGTTLPSLVTLEAMSMLLCVSIADLLTEEAFPRPGKRETQAESNPNPTQPLSRSEERRQFLMMLESLPPDERSAVMDVLTTLVDFLRKQRSLPGKASQGGFV